MSNSYMRKHICVISRCQMNVQYIIINRNKMMKKLLFTMLMMMSMSCSMAQDIQLPTPDKQEKTLSVVEALAARHSVRSYTDQQLTAQQLSNLCWAAAGVSRDANHRTAPTAMNRQEIRLYAFTAEGAYEYDAPTNVLKLVAKGDHRDLVAGPQEFAATAPVSLVMVIDFEKFGKNDQRALMMGCVDAGNVSENINLYCQAAGLATVPRATMDVAGLRSLLGLTDQQLPIMNNPVGWEKK